jgi:ABC-type transport system involved in multi-copper enzyme maturation permease subunit
MGWVIVALLVGASFVPFLLIVAQDRGGRHFFPEAVNAWVRGVGTGVACLLLLGVAVRAAHSVSGERERHTLDELLTTPLKTEEILYAKWYGSVWSLRWGWVWLAGIYGLGVLTGGVHLLSLPLLLVAWFVYVSFAAMLGVWFSTICRTSLRASVWTVLSLILLWGGHWLLWVCCGPLLFLMSRGPGGGEELLTVLEFQAAGLTPPFTLGLLAFHGLEFQSFGRRNPMVEMLAFALVGFIVWGCSASGVWHGAVARFNERHARTPRPLSSR